MAVIVSNNGMALWADMKCNLCGCEFKVTLAECTRDIIMGVKFYNYDCPCCGEECSCTKEDIIADEED